MKNLRTIALCLSLIIAGVLFNTGSAYAGGNGSKGGDTACTTQISPYGQPIIRCNAPGSKNDNSATPAKHRHHHHHYYHRHHRYGRHHGSYSRHHGGRNHGGHHGRYGSSCRPSHHSAHHGRH